MASRPISEVDDLLASISSAATVEEVITFAHVFAVPPERLSFNMSDDEMPV